MTSDRELSRRISTSTVAVSLYKTGRALPEDETLVQLADLAGIDPLEALIELNCWRAERAHNERASAIYRKHLARMRGAAATVLFVAGMLAATPAPTSANTSGTGESASGATVYYGKNRRRRRHRADRAAPAPTVTAAAA